MSIFSWDVKRCSIVTEMQITTTVRYHLTLVRRTIIKKSANNKCWSRCVKKGTLLHCWWEYKLVQPLWRTVFKLLKKTKNRASGPAIPLLDMHPKKTIIEKDTFTIARAFPLDGITDSNGHEFEQALGVGDGQGSLACCSPWGHKESDMTERPNWTELNVLQPYVKIDQS